MIDMKIPVLSSDQFGFWRSKEADIEYSGRVIYHDCKKFIWSSVFISVRTTQSRGRLASIV